MATHSSVFAWRIPGMVEPGGLHLWGHIELDTTEATQQQKQQKELSSSIALKKSSGTPWLSHCFPHVIYENSSSLGSSIVDIGSGQIFDVVGILSLMYTFLYHNAIYYKKLHSEKNNPHDRPTSGLKILQVHCFISVYTYVYMFFAEGPQKTALKQEAGCVLEQEDIFLGSMVFPYLNQ